MLTLINLPLINCFLEARKIYAQVKNYNFFVDQYKQLTELVKYYLGYYTLMGFLS